MPAHLLFLVADTGGGHRASAEAVARRLAAAYPGRFATHVLDPFVQASPRLVGRVVGLYSPITRYTPWLWGALLAATFTAVHAVYWTDMRMRAPLVPFVSLVAAAGAAAIGERFLRRKS